MSGFDYFKRAITERYADFDGRARRAEYWNFALFTFLLALPLIIFMAIAGAADMPILGVIAGILILIISLGLIVPQLAVGVRRLHDTGRSGWWMLIQLVPFGTIVLFVFMVLDSEPGGNKWGPNPKTGQGGKARYDNDVIDHLDAGV